MPAKPPFARIICSPRCSAVQRKSLPAENALSPAPVTIATRAALSATKSSHTWSISTWQAGCRAFMRSGRLKVMYAMWSRFSYLMNSRFMVPSLARFVDQFKKSIDTLLKLAADLRARTLDIVHRHPRLAAVLEYHLRVFHRCHLAIEDSHP